jgi:glycosyltransferase involved in cell wall biosynthesis
LGSHDYASSFELSVIIPSHNSARWLPSTFGALRRALSHAGRAVEVIVVDDGSTDETPDVLQNLAASSPFPLRIITQENRGRFLARWAGATSAKSDRLLLLDSRVLVAETSLTHVFDVESAEGTSFQWNGHVPTDPTAPLVGRFWEVPTHLFWAEYLADPRVLEITTANFDRVPKGTTFAMLDRLLFIEACRAAWPDDHAALTSDDTKILRHIVARRPLRLDPRFTATYRPRITVRSFLVHSYDRGTLFIDSYAGTSAFRNVLLTILLAVPVVVLAIAALAIVLSAWALLIGLALAVVAAIAATAVLARARCAPLRACVAFIVYVLPFGVAFWAGLVRGAIMHRAAFARRRHEETKGT